MSCGESERSTCRMGCNALAVCAKPERERYRTMPQWLFRDMAKGARSGAGRCLMVEDEAKWRGKTVKRRVAKKRKDEKTFPTAR